MARICSIRLYSCMSFLLVNVSITIAQGPSQEILRRAADPLEPRKLVSLLFLEDVRQELGLSKDVHQAIVRATAEMEKKSNAITAELVDASRSLEPTRIQQAVSKQLKYQRDVDDGMLGVLEELLTPDRMKRLKSIALQKRVQEVRIDNALLYGPLRGLLAVDSKQHEDLSVAFQELSKERQEEIDEIERRFREQIISKLNARQQVELRLLLGEPLDGLAEQPLPVQLLEKLKHSTELTR